MIASLFFSGGFWWWIALLSAAILGPLAWWATRPAKSRRGPLLAALLLRAVGIALVLLCLLEPQWVAPRAKPGANSLVLLADNSQGLQIREASANLSRGEAVKRVLTDSSARWLGRMNQDFQLRSYVFDRTLRRVPHYETLDFQGDRTSLGRALQEIKERFAGQPLAGILVFTDGNATDLLDGAPELSGLPPVYPVVVGRPGAARDLRIDRIDLRQTAFDDSPVSLRTWVSSHRSPDTDVTVALRPLARVRTTPRPEGAAGEDEGPPAAVREQKLRLRDGENAHETTFDWRPLGTGIQFYELSVEPEKGALDEATRLNNRRRLMIDRGRPAYRILYVSGRPNWDYKFFNRAVAEDPQLQMIGLIRVARREPKFEFKGRAGEASNPLFRGFGRGEDETARYDQPVLVRVSARDQNELRGGFPTTPEELFQYDAIIVDDLEAGFFTGAQQELLRRFAADRGGGLLFLGGADTLENGGYAGTPVAAALPVHLDRAVANAPVGALTWKLTREGWVEPWARVRAQEVEERERLEQMPPFQVANALSAIKPGATALATVEDQTGQIFPALVSHRYGSGRVAAVSVGDLWRWGLQSEDHQADLARFWRQVSRWLVTDATAPIALRLERAADGESVTLRTTARKADFKPMEDARVTLTVQRVDAAPAPGSGTPFSVVTLRAEPVADRPGEFVATLSLRDAGAYLAEAEVADASGRIAGRAEAGWVNDPLAEEFASLDPNRALLEEIARRTGGTVLEMADLDALAERLPKLSAPIMEAQAWPVWQQSWIMLLVLACWIAEWALRRWRGLP